MKIETSHTTIPGAAGKVIASVLVLKDQPEEADCIFYEGWKTSGLG